MSQEHIVTDYLVIGGGFSGLSFADELLTNTKSTITIVDRRDNPGGHWNDSYPFVKLHQPSSFYGVESTELTEQRIDESGPNKGLGSLATGVEIQAYCRDLLAKRFLPSGRVRYLACTEYQPDGTLRALLSGKVTTVEIKKKLVDATWYTNEIPLTHKRSFTVDPAVTCIPPNDLSRAALQFNHFTVLGAGKTALDACIWLLMNGADPDKIRWIIPNDYWYFNRATVQNGPQFFDQTLAATIESRRAIGQAKDAKDFAAAFEKSGSWLRLDPDIFPDHFHAAVISPAELAEVRKIKDVVRLGRVTKIEPRGLVLTKGTVRVAAETLYIDCTASAVKKKVGVPVFQPGKIVVQIVRFPAVTLSGAIIAFLESQDMSDEEKNALCLPVPFCNTVADYVVSFACDAQNRGRVQQHPIVSKWARKTRLDAFNALVAGVTPDQKEKMATLAEVKVASQEAVANLPRLLASVKKTNSATGVTASL